RVRFIGAIEAAAFGDFEAEVDILPDLLRQNIRRFIGRAVIFNERLPNFFRTRNDQLDLALQEEAEAVDRVNIERIAHRDDQSALAVADRDDLESARIF